MRGDRRRGRRRTSSGRRASRRARARAAGGARGPSPRASRLTLVPYFDQPSASPMTCAARSSRSPPSTWCEPQRPRGSRMRSGPAQRSMNQPRLRDSAADSLAGSTQRQRVADRDGAGPAEARASSAPCDAAGPPRRGDSGTRTACRSALPVRRREPSRPGALAAESSGTRPMRRRSASRQVDGRPCDARAGHPLDAPCVARRHRRRAQHVARRDEACRAWRDQLHAVRGGPARSGYAEHERGGVVRRQVSLGRVARTARSGARCCGTDARLVPVSAPRRCSARPRTSDQSPRARRVAAAGR